MSSSWWKRWLILFVGLWENLIFSGSILGWSALNHMLKQEGIFADLCTDHNDPLTAPLPFRNYTIDAAEGDDRRSSGSSSSMLGRSLDQYPLLNSYINYSVLPSVGPGSDLEVEAANVSKSMLLLSLPSATTTSLSLLQQSSTLPPTNSGSSSNLSLQLPTIRHSKVSDAACAQLSTLMPWRSASAKVKVHAAHAGCQAQDRMLNLAYTMGTFFNGFTAFVWGFLLDKWGLRSVRLLIK